MKTIWKFTLDILDTQSILMPDGAEILSVSEQFDMPVLYALVDSEASVTPRMVYIRGTGHPLNSLAANLDGGAKFVGTVKTMGGQLMWHVFA